MPFPAFFFPLLIFRPSMLRAPLCALIPSDCLVYSSMGDRLRQAQAEHPGYALRVVRLGSFLLCPGMSRHPIAQHGIAFLFSLPRTRPLSVLPRPAWFAIRQVGHSLGGGTAVLLTTMLRERPEFATVQCVAFACPGVVTLELARAIDGYVTTLVGILTTWQSYYVYTKYSRFGFSLIATSTAFASPQVNLGDVVPMFSAGALDQLRLDIVNSAWCAACSPCDWPDIPSRRPLANLTPHPSLPLRVGSKTSGVTLGSAA